MNTESHQSFDEIKCTYYKPELMDLFIPSDFIFLKLCIPRDKTMLFIEGVIRTVVWSFVLNEWYHLRDNKDLDYFTRRDVYKYVYLFLIGLVGFNLILTTIILFKRQKFDFNPEYRTEDLRIKNQESNLNTRNRNFIH